MASLLYGHQIFCQKKNKKCANVLHIDLIDTKFVDAKSFSDLLIFKEYAVLERLW